MDVPDTRPSLPGWHLRLRTVHARESRPIGESWRPATPSRCPVAVGSGDVSDPRVRRPCTAGTIRSARDISSEHRALAGHSPPDTTQPWPHTDLLGRFDHVAAGRDSPLSLHSARLRQTSHLRIR